MKITAYMAFWGALVFGLACFGFGLHGLWGLDGIADEAVRSDARGFAWFWLFLASIALVIGVISVLMVKGRFGELE